MGHIGKAALKKPSTLLALGNVFAPPPPPVFSDEYQAVIDKAIALGYTLPTVHQQILQDTLMQALVANGSFAKADLLYIMANDAGLNFARINWKNPNSYLLADYGTGEPIFYMNNYGPYTNTELSSTTAMGLLSTGWNPSLGVNFTQNNNCVIHSTKSGYASSGFPYRAELAASNGVLYYNLDQNRYFFNNSTSGGSTTANSNSVTFMNRRTAAAVCNLSSIIGGVVSSLIASVVASAARSNLGFFLLGSDINTAGAYPVSSLHLGSPMDFIFVGGALTDGEAGNFGNAVDTYLNTIRYAAPLFTTGNYTVPDGIYQLFVECFGAGGAGRGYANVAQTTTGGGGGGGAYAASLINVTPGQIIPFVVGAAGVGGQGAGGNGGDVSWNGGVVLAKGGGGAGTTPTTAAVGGQASASVGTTKYNGGNGGLGGSVLNASCGGGGSGAGALGNGIAGINAIAASAVAKRPAYNMLGPGAPGLSQNNTHTSNGPPAQAASGGGGTRRTTGTPLGGNGGVGFIRVSATRIY